MALWQLAAILESSYCKGKYKYSDSSGKPHDLEKMLRYVSMIIPRQVKLRLQTQGGQFVASSVTWSMEFPLVIDRRFGHVQKELENKARQLSGSALNSRDKLKACHDFIVNHARYASPAEIKNQDVHSAASLMLNGVAVCQGYASAFKIMCDAIRFPCVILIGSSKGEIHAWNLVYLDRQWLHVDVTWDDPICDVDILRWDYFLVSDDKIFEDHRCDGPLSFDSQFAFANWFYKINQGLNEATQRTPQKVKRAKPLESQKPDGSAVYISGKPSALGYIMIEEKPYVRLRDLAFCMKGMAKGFDINWDVKRNKITLLLRTSYTEIGGEMGKFPQLADKPKRTVQILYIDNQMVSVCAYNIGGYNYLSLSELGKAIGFAVMVKGSEISVI